MRIATPRVPLRAAALLFSLCPLALAAQGIVSGTITDEASGEPLIGVTVIVENTTTGTVTDLDGTYELTVAQFPAVLEASYIGFESREAAVAAPGTVDFALAEDVANLEEVVVTGLATSVKRSNLANAVSTVSGAELAEVTTQSTVDGALYGKLTGVNIVSTGGAPGGGIALRLRGISSLSGNNQPLFIVDGVYISNAEIPSGLRGASGANTGSEEGASNRLADLNPEDIENIEVLKGASAAAIYGTRANAGVVIITTKKGRAGDTDITFNQDFGVNTIQNYAGRRALDAALVDSIYGTSGVEAFNAAVSEGRLNSLEEEIYGNQGFISDSRLSVRGGSDKTTFYLNGSYRDEEGIIENTGFERASLRLNLTHEIGDRLTLTSSTNYVNSNAARSFTGNENEGGLSYGYVLSFTPDFADLLPDERGNYPDNPFYPGNPYLTRDIARNDETNNRLIQGVNLTYRAITAENYSLRFVGQGGLDLLASETDVYVPEFAQAQRGADNGFIAKGRNNITQTNYNILGVFNYYTDANVSFETQAGISYLNIDTDLIRSEATQLVASQTTLDQAAAQNVVQTVSEVEEFGYIAQQSVNFQDKLIVNAGVRLDKSSLNGDPNQLFAFPRASAALNLAEFEGLAGGAFNVLKVRAAFGQTGNSASFGRLFTPLARTSVNGQLGVTVAGNQGRADLEPERSTEVEVGLDVFVLNNRLGFEATYYDRSVTDLLYDRSLPTSTGFSSEIRNDLDLQNRGVELALSFNPIRTEAFSWNSRVNWWFNRSEVTRLGLEGGRQPDGTFAEGDIPSFTPPDVAFGLGLGTFFVDEGSPITAFFGNPPPDEPGPPIIIGDAEPDFQLGWFNQLAIGDAFDLSFLFHWKEGGDVLNLTRLLTDIGGISPDLPRPESPEAAEFGRENFIEDASYFRLREVGAYYTLPFANDFVERVRIGVSGRNVFTLTDYSSYDPEVSTKGGTGLSTGVEVTPFPSSRQFYGHLSFTF